jgi:hypothetical protein
MLSNSEQQTSFNDTNNIYVDGVCESSVCLSLHDAVSVTFSVKGLWTDASPWMTLAYQGINLISESLVYADLYKELNNMLSTAI